MAPRDVGVKDPSAQAGDEFSAGILAAPAHLGAYPAVFMHLDVLGAFITACLARDGANFQHRSREVGVVAGVPRKHTPRRVAHIGTIEVHTDALRQLGDHVFSEAGISTSCAGLCALEACLDTGAKLVLVDPTEVSGVGVEHLAGHAHGALPSSAGAQWNLASGIGRPSAATRNVVRINEQEREFDSHPGVAASTATPGGLRDYSLSANRTATTSFGQPRRADKTVTGA